ncbi:MAG: VOC family protein [Spirochaetia bacterium]|jgi:lactoylglutathione lyase|nr:VOC family protein [Spirochaetia bacterium]
MTFCWTTINVRDLAKSLAFYQDILGLEVKRSMKPAPDLEIAFLGNGETQVELICHAGNKDIAHGKDISLGFIVDSIDDFTRILAGKGIPVYSGPFQPNPFIKFIYIQDPDGLKIQLVENVKPD